MLRARRTRMSAGCSPTRPRPRRTTSASTGHLPDHAYRRRAPHAGDAASRGCRRRCSRRSRGEKDLRSTHLARHLGQQGDAAVHGGAGEGRARPDGRGLLALRHSGEPHAARIFFTRSTTARACRHGSSRSRSCSTRPRSRRSRSDHDPEKACPGRDPGWEPVFALTANGIRARISCSRQHRQFPPTQKFMSLWRAAEARDRAGARRGRAGGGPRTTRCAPISSSPARTRASARRIRGCGARISPACGRMLLAVTATKNN